MLAKTRALSLHYIKYGETGIVWYAYTRRFGRVALLVQGVRKSRARMGLNLFQPLQVGDIDFYHKEKPGLMRLKEIKSCHCADNLPLGPEKNAIALFLAEMLYKTLKEEVKNEDQFDFIESRVAMLDNLQGDYAVFYLKFLLDYTLYLGFFPNTNDMDGAHYFDLKNGVFARHDPMHEFTIHGETLLLMKDLVASGEDPNPALKAPRDERKKLLHALLDYYLLHTEGFSSLKSVAVLEGVFGG
jgi:DNA repair protein RecO (recombination protein O)